jgi:hypothetical protein
MDIRITLVEEMLGTKAANKDVFADYIASKCPDEDLRRQEIETVEHKEEAGTTVFHRDGNGNLILYDYQLKGFFKDACESLRLADGTKSKELKAYKKRIDGLIFVYPRMVKISLPAGTKPGLCPRPLRCQTMQGPRVSVARSESIPAGSYIECEIKMLSKDMKKYIEEWLDYGELRGLGQWRNSGKGRFTWEHIKARAK